MVFHNTVPTTFCTLQVCAAGCTRDLEHCTLSHEKLQRHQDLPCTWGDRERRYYKQPALRVGVAHPPAPPGKTRGECGANIDTKHHRRARCLMGGCGKPVRNKRPGLHPNIDVAQSHSLPLSNNESTLSALAAARAVHLFASRPFTPPGRGRDP